MLLATTLVFGFLLAAQLKPIAELSWLKWTIVSVTMFSMAWPLQFQALKAALVRPTPALLAVFVNFIVVPFIGWPISSLFQPELAIGIMVACCGPTTLATGPVWTRRAGGDDNVAMLVTIICNGICFLVTPILIFNLTGNEVPQSMFLATVQKLLLFVVLPIFLAQLLRLENRSANWVTQNKPLFGKIAQTGVLMMTTLGAVQTGLRMQAEETSLVAPQQLVELGLMLAAVLAIHVLAFMVGMFLAGRLGFPPDKQIAVGISGSQKTLMVGLSIAINLEVSILPMIAYHALQLVVDTFFADRHRRRHSPDENPPPAIESSEPR